MYEIPKDSEICLLNDSFPPLIDGVANTVKNYADILHESGYGVDIVTPEYPDADDSSFPYPVLRYQSFDFRKIIGYTAGNPLSSSVLSNIRKHNVSILHNHCPIASGFLSRRLRDYVNAPLITTYHTKFDVDIKNAIHGKLLQEGAIKLIVDNVSASDELWVVSRGAGENIKKLGYQGDYVIMPNGVDIEKGRATEAEILHATIGLDLPFGVPLFLFVGRLMWYKGLRIILDALAALNSRNVDYRAVFIGSSTEADEIKKYAKKNGLLSKCFFLGAIHDREVIKAWYSRADMFLFPSTFDTNGLVVREAAACGLGTVMIKDSCAAEGVTDMQDGILIEENAASLAVGLMSLIQNPDMMRKIGENAKNNLYLSWDDSIKSAIERYQIVYDNYMCGKYPKQKKLLSNISNLQADFFDIFESFESKLKKD